MHRNARSRPHAVRRRGVGRRRRDLGRLVAGRRRPVCTLLLMTGGGSKGALIGVVTPTLNAERFLTSAIESVWAQEGEAVAIDHVIVDGGSTDDTRGIASRYPSRLVSEKDGGMYEAVNRGFSLVEGDIVGYINADDEIAPGALRLVANAFRREPRVGWVCGTVEYIDPTGRPLGRMTPVALSLRAYAGLGWSCIPQQTVWARRSFLKKVGPFDTTFKNCADYDWYARALRLQPPLVLKQVIGRFRLHPGQISLNADRMRQESREIQRRYGGSGTSAYLAGRLLSLRLNAANPRWLLAKKTGKITFRARPSPPHHS